MTAVHEIEQMLGYTFRRPALLDEALTHKSLRHGHTLGNLSTASDPVKDNERLEFLGDTVLALVISEHIVSKFPHASEGELSQIKAQLVSRRVLAHAAARMRLGALLKLGRGEEVTHGWQKHSLLANTLEAVIGAIYLDGGLDPARVFVLRALDRELETLQRQGSSVKAFQDFKSHLQEHCQKQWRMLPVYRVIRESGPDHHKSFEVIVELHGQPYGYGVGKTKKEAEQAAAAQALERLESNGSADVDFNHGCEVTRR
ncbi:MAG: ribonuclease III [Nitrospirae bacterium]|nr:MAG: ribonuclease III [Nitrospirota bacterium]